MNENLKKIETEEEYWIKHKEYKKRMNKLTFNPCKFIKNPKLFMNEFDKLLAEMVYIELVTPEWANEKKTKLIKEMNSPNEFKDWVNENKDYYINKFKNKFRK